MDVISTVTIGVLLLRLLKSVISGLIIGSLARWIMHSSGSFLKNVLLGIAGAFVGGIAADWLSAGWFLSVLLDIGGACALIALFRQK